MQPKTYHATEHDIESAHVDTDALQVISTLREAGFLAYLVGGGVRDLLVKKKPKDFDISTSATPEDIKRLFRRNCIIIGKRFRLAHIRFGHKVLEVSTFRSGESDSDLIIRDNQWGNPEQDALRRDFTINGMFYDPAAHQVIDYVGGWDDIHKRQLRTIGDPHMRFKQDPVRMIRALKFQARFGFSLENATEQSLRLCKQEIVKSSPARILEELFRMLESAYAAPFFRLMRDYELMQILFPIMSHFIEGRHGEEIYRYLAAADVLQATPGRPSLDRSVLSACLIYPILEKEVEKQFTEKGNVPHLNDISILASSIIEAVVTSSFSHFPRRISSAMIFILATQYRFTPLGSKRHFRPHLFRDKDFPYALQFLRVRTVLDRSLEESYAHWKEQYRHQRDASKRRAHPAPNHHQEQEDDEG